jgi:type III secretory pathway lipoprotein EscJ
MTNPPLLLLLLLPCLAPCPQALLDRLERLNAQALDMDVVLLDKKIDQMMPELGFMPQVCIVVVPCHVT